MKKTTTIKTQPVLQEINHLIRHLYGGTGKMIGVRPTEPMPTEDGFRWTIDWYDGGIGYDPKFAELCERYGVVEYYHTKRDLYVALRVLLTVLQCQVA